MNNKNPGSFDLLSKQYWNNIIPTNILEAPTKFISTGNMILDQTIGIGIPKARITEIFGNESCGKTTLTLQIAKECTLQQKKVLYIDLEYALDINYVKGIGVDTNYFYVAHARNGEIAFGMIENALENQGFDLIIIDSVAAMVPEDEMDSKIENINPIGAHARLMSRGIRRIQATLANSDTALVFINQIREKIGIMYGNNETTTGGKALKYYASLRLELKKIELIKDGMNKIGIKTKITAVKNKINKPFGSCFVNIFFGEGFNYACDVLEYAINNDVIKKNGNWYAYENKNICQGFNQLKSYANEHPEWFKTIKQICIDNLNVATNNTSSST